MDQVYLWHREIADASARTGVPVSWIERVVRAESCGRTRLNGQPIVSPAGAMGLMQLMPETWGEMRTRYALGPDPHAPRDNILAGAAYLRLMYERFGYPGLYAAYNAGPGRYSAHLKSGKPLPAETRIYLQRVAGGHVAAKPIGRKPEKPALFVVRFQQPPDAADKVGQLPASPSVDPMFAVRRRP
nr:lytic transglycosylase domain-containing protein [Sandaracinobacteroides hominis]